MTTLKPKGFIQSVLIDELGSMIDKHPYFSFVLMGIGIEFLGKAIHDSLYDWNVERRSGPDFKRAIKTIPSLKRYEPSLSKYDLYGSFRCGLAHTVAPKYKITLSSKGELGHLTESLDSLNLKVEDFYKDFKAVCEYVIGLEFPPKSKMNKVFLQVPGSSFNEGTNIPAGMTQSLAPAPPPTGASASSTAIAKTFGSERQN